MPTTPSAAPATGPDAARTGPDATGGRTAGHEPAAADLARAAARAAGDLLAPPAPVRLADVVPAPRAGRAGPDGRLRAPRRRGDPGQRRPGRPRRRRAARRAAPPRHRLPAAGHRRRPTRRPARADHRRWRPSPPTGPPSRRARRDEGYRLDVATDGVRITAATAGRALPRRADAAPAAAGRHREPDPGRRALGGARRHDRRPAALRLPGRDARRGPALLRRRPTCSGSSTTWPATSSTTCTCTSPTTRAGGSPSTPGRGWPTVGGATEVGGGPGGYYTKADYRRIVAYAARRHVTVVPEIDLPGHTNAALVSYPELATADRAAAVHRHRGRLQLVDPADERTYDFVDDVLGELAALTPGPYLHIGGDEAFKVQGRGVHRLRGAGAARSSPAHGKTVVGWHQLAPAAHLDGRVLQCWGTNGDDPDDRRRRYAGAPG